MCIQFCSDNNNNNKVTLAALYTCTEYSVFTMIIIMITKEFYYIPNSIHIYLIINYTYIDNKIRLIRWEIGRKPWGSQLPGRVCKASFESIARRDGREPWGTLGALGNPDTIASEMRGEMGGSLWEPWGPLGVPTGSSWFPSSLGARLGAVY